MLTEPTPEQISWRFGRDEPKEVVVDDKTETQFVLTPPGSL
jgi:hypothetical protein